MIDYKRALDIARDQWDEIDYFQEQDKAFIFSKKDDRSFGGNGPVVVLKDTGECLNMPAYICEGLSSPTINEGYIKD